MKPTGPIPKSVKCVRAVTDSYTESKEYSVDDLGFVIDNRGIAMTQWDDKCLGSSKFQPIYTDEELLEYAKKMYPEGTEFFNSKGEYRKSEGVNYLINRDDGCIDVQAFAKDGTRLAPDIYSPATGWVEIIDVEQQEKEYHKQTYMFKEGDPVLSKVHPGVTGFTVCGFEDKKSMYLICSPTWRGGHNGANVVPVWGKVPDTSNNSCWWVHEDSIVLDNQLKEKDIDTSQINVGDYVKIIDKPADGSVPTFWNMDYLYGTWQEVLGMDNDGDVQIYCSTGGLGVWYIHISHITAVKSYNPNKYISGCDVAIKGGDVTVTDIVDVDPSKPFVAHLGDAARAAHFKNLSEMQPQYNIRQHGFINLIRDSEDYLMFGNKAKEDMLPVPSLRVSRKNIKK